MWRASSDGEDRPSRGWGPVTNGENGSGFDPIGGPGVGRGATDDPRSELTGRKIRRIESGPPGTHPERARRDRTLAQRPASPADADDTQRGGPPPGTAGRRIGRPGAADPSRNGAGVSAGDGRGPTEGGSKPVPSLIDGGPGGLPPLRQPTGEQPAVPGFAADPSAVASGSGGDGVFGDDRPSGSVAPSAMSGTPRDNQRPRKTASPTLRPDRGFDRSAQPASFAAEQPDAFPNWGGAGAGARPVDDGAAGRVPGGDRNLRRPGPERRAALDAPTSHGPSGNRLAARPTGAQRMQETEIKLAGRREAPERPQEPNRMLLLLAVIVVVAAGAGVAWWLTRGDDDEGAAAPDNTPATGDPASETAAPAAPVEPAPDPILDVPELSLVGVEPGPLDPETKYSIDLFGEAPGSLLQVVVDGVPQAEPELLLPDLILPAGRHTLTVTVTNGAEVTTSTPVDLYVLGPPPAAGQLANLASIDMLNEGWAEALRRYDGYQEAGHRNLQLLPITPGYWNIFASGLGADVAAVTSYCEEFGLAVPDDCFAKTFDPATYVTPAGPAPATGQPTGDESTEDESGSMTDQGGETSSTTTGG